MIANMIASELLIYLRDNIAIIFYYGSGKCFFSVGGPDFLVLEDI